MKVSLLVAVLASFADLTGTANASPITWQVSADLRGFGLAADNGGFASGVFTYDATTNVYSNWSINISSFFISQLNALLTPATSSITSASPTSLQLRYLTSPEAAFLRLAFVAADNSTPRPLDNSGGTVNVQSGLTYRSPLGQIFWSGNGVAAAVPVPVPEPASASLLLLAGAALAFCWFLFGFRPIVRAELRAELRAEHGSVIKHCAPL